MASRAQLVPAADTPSTTSPDETTEASGDGDERDVIDDPPSKTWQDALDAANEEFSGDVNKIGLEESEDDGLEYKVELLSADTE